MTTHADTEKNEPAALRRRDGSSVYTRHDSTVYTSTDILAAERRILAAAALRDGRTVDDTSIGLALLEYQANQGLALNAGQVALVREMATSGARVQLALAPAGTGKTTAMATLADRVAQRRRQRHRARPLRRGGRSPRRGSRTLPPTLSPNSCSSPTRAAGNPRPPMTRPETGSTPSARTPCSSSTKPAWPPRLDLDTVIAHALARGASVRLIGDDQQLASISAGGILRDLADRHETVTLSTVVRFTHPETGPAEAAASLAIRAGDPSGIGFYIDHHRVHVGADATAADMAYQAWAADIAAGRDSILLAPTNPLVAELNERARLDRLAHTTNHNSDPASAATVTLADGLTASAGDWIATRKNARWLRTAQRGHWVKNGHRWIIRTVHDDGSLTVVPLRGRATPVRLPARYVSTYTTLGYASTINAAQGMTAGGRDIEGTCHTVISDRLNRRQLYVAGTRGRTENHFYGSTAEADPHRILAPKATHPPTAVDILSAILARDGAQLSAHSAAAADSRPVHPPAPGGRHVRRRPDRRRRTACRAPRSCAVSTPPQRPWAHTSPRLKHGPCCAATWPCWPSKATTPSTRCTTRPAPRLASAHDAAAVLDWRLPTPSPQAQSSVGPLRWLPATPDVLADHPQWGPYLRRRAQLVAELADQIRDTARAWDPNTAPAWARPLVDQRSALMAEIAVFRAAHNVDPADTRITGPEQHANRSAIVQQLIHARLDADLTRAGADTARWRQLAEQDRHPHHRRPVLAPAGHPPRRRRPSRRRRRRTAATRPSPRTAHCPHEMPAAALWWRLAGTLAPPSLERADTKLRPPWTAELHHLLGTRIAEAVITDPAWPGLVAAVAASDWPPADLLAAAADHLHDIAATQTLRPDEYARLLTYRIELLTHHAATIDPDIPHPAEQAETPSAGTEPDPHARDIDPPDDLHEPPPDPYDYPYGFAEDDLAGLDIDDLPRQRVAAPGLVDDIDIPALRARRDAAQHHAQQLADAILNAAGGPAEQAAGPELADLHRRLNEQRPYQQALARAHTLWVHAEDTAELHHQLLDQLSAAVTAANNRVDHQAATRYQQHRDQVTEQTQRINTAVHTARTRLDTARAELIRRRRRCRQHRHRTPHPRPPRGRRCAPTPRPSTTRVGSPATSTTSCREPKQQPRDLSPKTPRTATIWPPTCLNCAPKSPSSRPPPPPAPPPLPPARHGRGRPRRDPPQGSGSHHQ